MQPFLLIVELILNSSSTSMEYFLILLGSIKGCKRNKTLRNLINTFPKFISLKKKIKIKKNPKCLFRKLQASKLTGGTYEGSVSSVLLLPVPQLQGHICLHTQKEACIHEVKVNVYNTHIHINTYTDVPSPVISCFSSVCV